MRCLAIVISPASTISIRKGRNGKAIERKCQRHPIHSYIHPPHSPAKRYESKHQPFLFFFLPLCFASPPGKKIAIGLDSRRAPPRRTASFRSPTHDRIRGTGGCSRVSTAGAKQRVLSSSGAGAEAKNRRRRRSAALAFDRVVARSHSANS